MFDSAKLKIGRAEHHMFILNKTIQDYITSFPPSLAQDGRYELQPASIELRRPLPPDLMLIAGDVLHNLRAALDHCVWEMTRPYRVQLSPGKLEKVKTMFPFNRKGRVEFERMIRQDPAFSGSVERFLLSLETFVGGQGDDLWRLHEADIDDKHELTLPNATQIVLSGFYVWRKPFGGEETKSYDVNRTYGIYYDPKGQIGTTTGNVYGRVGLGDYARHPDGPHLRHDNNWRLDLILSFASPPFEGKPIEATLAALRHRVAGVIAEAEARQLGNPYLCSC